MVFEKLARWLKSSSPAAQPLDADEVPPPWAIALLEAVQKSSRAQAKASLKLEDLERKLEGGIADLRSALATHGASAPQDPLPRDLLDAMDLLEEVARASSAADPALAHGLRGVLERLERYLATRSLERRAPVGVAPDPRLFRVVGADSDPALPDGVVARVVRAAVVQGDSLMREGEVLTNRRPT